MTNLLKLEEEYLLLPDAITEDTLEPVVDEDTGIGLASSQTNLANAESVDIMDFWRATQESTFVQAHDNGRTQWAPGLHESRTEANDDGLLPHISGNTTLRYTPDASFYLPNSLLVINPFVAPYEAPPADVAYRLISHYLQTCHEWIPLLPYDFEAQVQRYYKVHQEVTSTWLAIFNLVLAIGARQSYVTNRVAHTSNIREREDIPYISRAIHLLGLRGSTLMTTDPDLLQVQVSSS
tara:strand:- start:40573 stop:41283 length:711 start_codon:yes stop_codon:yes gene_type:complete